MTASFLTAATRQLSCCVQQKKGNMGATCCCLGREREPRAAPQCLLGHPGPAQPAPQPKEPAKEEKEKQTLHHEEDKTKEKEKLVLDDEDFEGFTTKVKSHTHGSKNDNDHLAEVRGSWCFGEPVSQQLVHILCQKGLKGASSPNQDSFSVTHFASGWTLMCILDGHGQHGHQIASRIAWTIPSFLVRDFLSLGEEEAQDSQVENALIMAFENAHFDVLAYAAEQKLNVKLSGTTAVVALVKAGTVYLAHAGDSRAVVGAVQGKHLIASTKDHSPADEGEKAGSLDLFAWPCEAVMKPLSSRHAPVPALRHQLQGTRGILRGPRADRRVPGWHGRCAPCLHQGEEDTWFGDDQSHRRQNRIALLECC